MNPHFSWQSLYYGLSHQFSGLQQELRIVNQENSKLQETLNSQLLKKQEIEINQSIEEDPEALIRQQPDISEQSEQIEKKPTKHLNSKDIMGLQSKYRVICYNCPYDNCKRIYKSAISMNLHIKINHNGGTKKQRQAYAKKIIQAEQGLRERPEAELDLPPNFLEQFKKDYIYKKKYNM